MAPSIRRRASFEVITGADWSESRQKFVSRAQGIDRHFDLYTETVIDREADEVIRGCEEPL